MFRRMNHILYLPLSLICLLSFSCSIVSGRKANNTPSTEPEQVTIEVLAADSLLGIKPNSNYILKDSIDLEGKTYRLPKNVTIIPKGGCFYNGGLLGCETTIKDTSCIFDHVTIGGEWNVKQISTSMFKDMGEINSLKNVIALASSNCQNHIVIEKADYWVSTLASSAALMIPSNSELEINGNIRLVANDYRRCYVLGVIQSENVYILGNGTLYGDKISHEGTEGEWGHGVYIASSQNVSVHNIGIRDCWGDCIYIGSQSKKIEVKHCNLVNGRRQGISVTYATDVNIEDCYISDVRGTRPGCGIDIEPNPNYRVDSVRIKRVKIINCYRGISIGKPENAYIGTVSIQGCSISGTEIKSPVVLSGAEKITLENCYIETDTRKAVRAVNVKDVKIRSNRIKSKGEEAIYVGDCIRSIVSNNRVAKDFR